MHTSRWPWLFYFFLALSARVIHGFDEDGSSSFPSSSESSSVDRSIRAASPLRWGKRVPLRWGKRGFDTINPPGISERHPSDGQALRS
ncbi:Uncharacterized protein FKW44_023831 [Caligus rogercresseyi]|uniref:Uncharacterized protein n=1 Tax=Caligus rogercresseyi TaxID=217165 RepID=A0A7T8GQ32_CALRO|nr:Uncharacterized protein FKW44_023831 [Caligus rogercresseyi]